MRISKVHVEDLSDPFDPSLSHEGAVELAPDVDPSYPQELMDFHQPTRRREFSSPLSCFCSAGSSVQHRVADAQSEEDESDFLEEFDLEDLNPAPRCVYQEPSTPVSLFDLKLNESCLNFSINGMQSTKKAFIKPTNSCCCFAQHPHNRFQSVTFENLNSLLFEHIRVDLQLVSQGQVGVTVELEDINGVHFFGTTHVTITKLADIRVIQRFNVKCKSFAHQDEYQFCGSMAWRLPLGIKTELFTLCEKEVVSCEAFAELQVVEKELLTQVTTISNLEKQYLNLTCLVSRLKQRTKLKKPSPAGERSNHTTSVLDSSEAERTPHVEKLDIDPNENLEEQLQSVRGERAEVWKYLNNERVSLEKNEHRHNALQTIYSCLNQEESSDGSDWGTIPEEVCVDDISERMILSIICPLCSGTLTCD